MSFGRRLGHLEPILRGFCSQKSLKTCIFFKVFVNGRFWFFEVPVGLFGLILVLLGCFEIEQVSKKSVNVFQKVVKHKCTQCPKFCANLGSKIGLGNR